MIEIKQTYWEIVSEDDFGRVTGVHSRWSSKSMAEKMKPDGYWYRVKENKIDIKIFDSVAEYEIENNAQLVKQALSKLSEEEKNALGVKFYER